MSLADKILKGDEGSAARLITLIENMDRKGYDELTRLLPYTGKAHIVGVTGPAGAGKSTIIAKLVNRLSKQKRRAGVIAIDPTSVQSRGAVLGDRLRMKEIEDSGETFIRSMADREHPGGICRAALGAVYVMEAMGKEFVIIESVGAGQSDKALFLICDTIVTVFTPEFGDEIQLLKAGLLEIGDIVVINKGDKAEAQDAVCAISGRLPERSDGDWVVPVILTEARAGKGIDDLVNALEARWRFIQDFTNIVRTKREKVTSFIMTLLKEELWQRFFDACSKDEGYRKIMNKVESGTIDPYSAVEEIGDIVTARLQEKQEVKE
ncbi:MAG: putative GTPase [Syntrophorhabdus sp. PtaU1.Bin058]|nr:MAG: putative GTPase [Syntrophorhabdus sp. PtaU1.Bin058]